jgi:hypothetical protein
MEWYRSGRELTAEARRARSKEFLIKKYSELCELCASVVKKGFLLCQARHCVVE